MLIIYIRYWCLVKKKKKKKKKKKNEKYKRYLVL